MRVTEALFCAIANVAVGLLSVALAFIVREPVVGTLLVTTAAPALLLLSLFFALRDLLGGSSSLAERHAAWLALALSAIPVGLLLGLARSLSGRLPLPVG